MSIVGKINDIHLFVEANKDNDAGKNFANALKLLAVQAIRYGISSRAWEEYMTEFAKEGVAPNEVVNPLKLKRLMGEDNVFNATHYAEETLSYIAANATCDVGTTVGTRNGLTPPMRFNLDVGFVPPNPS